MRNRNFNQKEQKSTGSDKRDTNSVPIQPIYEGTFRPEFHILGDAGDAKSIHGHFNLVDDDERNWSDEYKKEREELLKQKLLPTIKEMHKKLNEQIEAIVMEEVEKIKAVKKDIERDLETIGKEMRKLKQLCDFIEKVFDKKA